MLSRPPLGRPVFFARPSELSSDPIGSDQSRAVADAALGSISLLDLTGYSGPHVAAMLVVLASTALPAQKLRHASDRRGRLAVLSRLSYLVIA